MTYVETESTLLSVWGQVLGELGDWVAKTWSFFRGAMECSKVVVLKVNFSLMGEFCFSETAKSK
jgi:hypothetical protein